MNRYAIHIGEMYDVTTKVKTPKQTIIITQEQFEIIQTFANQLKDSDLDTIYKINECEFRVLPHFEDSQFCQCGTKSNELNVNARCESCNKKLDPFIWDKINMANTLNYPEQ